jgi:hypothetical protein
MPHYSEKSVQNPFWGFFVLVWFFWRQGFSMEPRLALNSRASCLSLPLPSATYRHVPPFVANIPTYAPTDLLCSPWIKGNLLPKAVKPPIRKDTLSSGFLQCLLGLCIFYVCYIHESLFLPQTVCSLIITPINHSISYTLKYRAGFYVDMNEQTSEFYTEEIPLLI